MKFLIIDGYNTIHKIPYLEKKMDKSPQEARKALIQLAREYKRKTGGIADFYVVFDSKDEHTFSLYSASANQIFARDGEGDRQIIDLVRRFSGKYQIIVVSEDNFVRNNARAHRAKVISASEFAGRIRKKNLPKREEGPGKKIDPQAALKINEELKKHWRL